MDILISVMELICYIAAFASLILAWKAKDNGDNEKYKVEMLWAIFYVLLAK